VLEGAICLRHLVVEVASELPLQRRARPLSAFVATSFFGVPRQLGLRDLPIVQALHLVREKVEPVRDAAEVFAVLPIGIIELETFGIFEAITFRILRKSQPLEHRAYLFVVALGAEARNFHERVGSIPSRVIGAIGRMRSSIASIGRPMGMRRSTNLGRGRA